jgi:hypothetical protein
MAHIGKTSGQNADLNRLEKYSKGNPLKRRAYFRVPDFLTTEVAEGAYAELINDSRYVRTDKMPIPTGIGLGLVKAVDQCLSPNVQKCCDLLTGSEFRSCLMKRPASRWY